MCFFRRKKKPRVPHEKTRKTTKKDTALKNAKYHVSQNKDAKSEHFKWWRVRKDGSNKTIKYFSTQEEAIDFAAALAKAGKTSIVVHKLDGSIRKQKY